MPKNEHPKRINLTRNTSELLRGFHLRPGERRDWLDGSAVCWLELTRPDKPVPHDLYKLSAVHPVTDDTMFTGRRLELLPTGLVLNAFGIIYDPVAAVVVLEEPVVPKHADRAEAAAYLAAAHLL